MRRQRRVSFTVRKGSSAYYFDSLVERYVASSTIRGYFSSINTRHAAAGIPKPAFAALVAHPRKGHARLQAERTNSFPFARGPLPDPVLWQIVCWPCAGQTRTGGAASRPGWFPSLWRATHRTSWSYNARTCISVPTAVGIYKSAASRQGRRGRTRAASPPSFPQPIAPSPTCPSSS